MDIETLISHLNYQESVAKAIQQTYSHSTQKIRDIAETAYAGEAFPLCHKSPLTRLGVVQHLLLSKYQEYKMLGICEDIILDTFRDVSLRANLYFETFNAAGLSKADVIWFRHLMKINLFKIGSLQFQPFNMIYLDEETIGEPYMVFEEAIKEALPSGAPVINCHIQQRADLTPAAIESSWRRAASFFSCFFPKTQYQAFLCYSWLLYPKMLPHLSEPSNIKRFAEQFTIIGSCADAQQALEYLLPHAKQSLPKHATSLQKLAFERPDLFGYACGIRKL
ncbi:hypothetical protein ABB02_02013 [Clostridiaceae bacterium JG1575]|nr:hypothetical protein ABB02_02013 [Clostridiaceae bacterium JG1575]